MKRMAIGAVFGLATWFGSALAAEAQVVLPSGPMSVTAGQQSVTYTATITLPTPANFIVKLWVYRGTTQLCFSTTIVSNPNTNTYYFSKAMNSSQWNLHAGDSLRFAATLTVLSQTYNATDWFVTVAGTRPSSKMSSAKSGPTMAFGGVDRDRRKE